MIFTPHHLPLGPKKPQEVSFSAELVSEAISVRVIPFTSFTDVVKNPAAQITLSVVKDYSFESLQIQRKTSGSIEPPCWSECIPSVQTCFST